MLDTAVDYDTLSRSGTGFAVSSHDSVALLSAGRRALATYHGDAGSFIGRQRRAMRADFSWSSSAKAYLSALNKLQSKADRVAAQG